MLLSLTQAPSKFSDRICREASTSVDGVVGPTELVTSARDKSSRQRDVHAAHWHPLPLARGTRSIFELKLPDSGDHVRVLGVPEEELALRDI